MRLVFEAGWSVVGALVGIVVYRSCLLSNGRWSVRTWSAAPGKRGAHTQDALDEMIKALDGSDRHESRQARARDLLRDAAELLGGKDDGHDLAVHAIEADWPAWTAETLPTMVTVVGPEGGEWTEVVVPTVCLAVVQDDDEVRGLAFHLNGRLARCEARSATIRLWGDFQTRFELLLDEAPYALTDLMYMRLLRQAQTDVGMDEARSVHAEVGLETLGRVADIPLAPRR